MSVTGFLNCSQDLFSTGQSGENRDGFRSGPLHRHNNNNESWCTGQLKRLRVVVFKQASVIPLLSFRDTGGLRCRIDIIDRQLAFNMP